MGSRPKGRELKTAVEPIGNRIERLTITSRREPLLGGAYATAGVRFFTDDGHRSLAVPAGFACVGRRNAYRRRVDA